MKTKSLSLMLSRGILLRLAILSVVFMAMAVLWFFVFESRITYESLKSLLILAVGIVLFSVYAYGSVFRFVEKVAVEPLLELKAADEASALHLEHYHYVDLEPYDVDEFQKIAQFRNTILQNLEQKKRQVELKGPLDAAVEEVDHLIDGVIGALEKANMYNDDDTGSHMNRIAMYSEVIARKKGLPDKFVSEIMRYASLHDVGKIGIPDEILKKPDRLDPEEWEVMKTHSKIGYDLLKSVGLNPIAQNIALYHHEWWTGMGYPEGLKGEEIPIEARIVAIADVFDALVNARVYKPAFERDKVERIMFSEIGTHFDPELGKIAYEHLDHFYAILKENADA